MDEVELIKKVQAGDEQAFKTILFNYKNMIYKIINQFDQAQGDYLIDKESLYQEGSVALYTSCLSYEFDKGTKFSTFAYLVIRMRIITYIRDNYSHESIKKSIDNNDNGFDYQQAIKNMCVSEDPIAYHREKEFEEYLHKFILKLSKEDQNIIAMRQNDFSYKEISEKLHISTKKVDNRLRSIKKRLREYINKNK